MSENAEARLTHVRSADGTEIAVRVSGAGRPLVMVPGITSDHTTWRLAAPLLSREVCVHAVDRRGRGDGGDGPDYAIEREYDDVAAVVDAADALVLLLVGADSPAELQADPKVVAEALPDARIDVLAGQAHLAHLVDPETFTAHVLAFVRD